MSQTFSCVSPGVESCSLDLPQVWRCSSVCVWNINSIVVGFHSIGG